MDLATTEEAERATEELEGREMKWGGRLRVNRAKGESNMKKVVREPRVTLNDFTRLRISQKENVNANGIGIGEAALS